jgi:hypothetical protein
MDDYQHGSVEYMQKMLDKLYVLSGNRGTPEHLQHLKDLIGLMDPSFFYSMDLYIKNNAEDTMGMVDLDKKHILIDLAKLDAVVDKPEIEVYAEEIVHTMTAYALRSPYASKYRGQLEYAMKQIVAKAKWQDLLDADVSLSSPEQIKKAKELYRYVFASTNQLDETLAHVLTNPKIMAIAKKIPLTNDSKHNTLFSKIMSVFFKVINIAVGNFDYKDRSNNTYDQIHGLAFSLARVNLNTEAKLDNLSIFSKFSKWFHDIDTSLGNTIREYEDKLLTSNEVLAPYPENGSPFAKAYWLMKGIAKGITNPTYRGAIGLWASSLGLAANGSIREVLRNFLPRVGQDLKEAEWDNLQAAKIDGIRMSYINQVKQTLVKGFKERPTAEQEKAMTRVLLDTNLTHLLYRDSEDPGKKQYTIAEVKELLSDDSKLETRLGRIKHQIKNIDPTRYNWLQNQAVSMGYYMATHKAHAATNFNARNIAIGIGYGKKEELNVHLAGLIDELATLVALKYTDRGLKTTVKDLLINDLDGVNNIINTYEAFKKESKKDLFSDDRVHIVTGYSREVFDPHIDVVHSPISDRAYLEKIGYKYQGPLTAKHGVGHNKPMGIFVSSEYLKAERLRGSVNLSKSHTRGTSIRDIHFENDSAMADLLFTRDKIKLDSVSRTIHERMAKGVFNVEDIEYGIAPTYNAKGAVVDYRMMMDKERKENLLKQDVSVTEVLSRSIGTLVDKKMRKDLNEKVLKTIADDMRDNWEAGDIGKKDFTEYALIGPNTTDPEMRKLYYMLPDRYREFINKRSDKTMAIPKVLLNTYFGYSHVRISDTLKSKGWTPVWLSKFVDMAQTVWEEMIKLVKGNILLKMPAILLGNFISNIFYLLSTQNITVSELFKMYRDSWKDTVNYTKGRREAIELELDIKRDKADLGRVRNVENLRHIIANKELKLKSINMSLRNSPIHELFASGMYQTIVEDVETSTTSTTNMWKKKTDEVMNKTHPWISNTAKVLYLSQDTKWYQVNQEFLQISDLLARDIMNRRQKIVDEKMADGEINFPYEWLKTKGTDYPKKKKLVGSEREEWFRVANANRMNAVLESFINYSKPNGRGEEFLNRTGLLMFTKYVKGIQRVIANSSARNPIKSLLALLVAGFMLDQDHIQEQNFVIKGFDSEGWSITNVFPVYNPVDHVMNVVTPGLIKEDGPLGLVL